MSWLIGTSISSHFGQSFTLRHPYLIHLTSIYASIYLLAFTRKSALARDANQDLLHLPLDTVFFLVSTVR
jgi:hypothetical protein